MPLPARLLFLLLFLAAGAPAGAQTLSVIQAFPEGEVRHLTQIVARFSEDMRPLGFTEQDAATSPLRLETPGGELPAGNWRWLDPETLAYLFERPVEIPLRLEAGSAADAEALSGNRPAGEKKPGAFPPLP